MTQRAEPFIRIFRRVCVLHACDGRTQQEAAALLGMGVRTINLVRRRAGIPPFQRRVSVPEADLQRVLAFLGIDAAARQAAERDVAERAELVRQLAGCREQLASAADDQRRLQELLERERADHHQTRQKIAALEAKVQELRKQLRPIDEQRLAQGIPRSDLDARRWPDLTTQERMLKLHGGPV